MKIYEVAVKRPVFVVMIVLSIIVLGMLGYSRLGVDLLPNVEFPTVSVSVIYPGAASEEMESLITKPLEDAFGTLEGVDTINSISQEGVSVVSVSFNLDVDIKFAEINLREKLQLVRPILPKDINEPLINRFSFANFPVLTLSLKGDQDLTELREIVENDLKPSLERIKGVGNVTIFGSRKKIVRITIDKALLLSKGISYNQIINAINSRNLNFPVGDIKGAEKNISLRITSQYQDIEEIKNTPITGQLGTSMRSSISKILCVGDVATVSYDMEEESIRSRVDGKDAVLFAVYKQSGENSVEVAQRIYKEMKKLSSRLPYGTESSVIMDMTRGIKRSVRSVEEDILIGALLSILIVWLFLGNFKSTLITAVALPNSIIGAFFFMYIAGFTINVMTLLALSLTVGLLIDDSIVVRENIFRYIEKGLKPKEAAVKGTGEVALAVLSTTLSILAVFVPISFLSGVVGQFFREFGLTITFALLISLLDAFTTGPMLSAYWYTEKKKPSNPVSIFLDKILQKWEKFYSQMSDVYIQILKWALGHKKKVAWSILGLFLFSLVTCGFVNKGFNSTEDRGIVSLTIETYPGAPLDKIDAAVKKLEAFFSQRKEISSYFVTVGSGFDQSSAATNKAFILLNLVDIHKRRLSNIDIARITREFIDKNLIQDIKFSISEMGPGGDDSSAPVLIKVMGPDLNQLEKISEKALKIVYETAGTTDVDSSYRAGKPEVLIKIDSLKAEKLGFTTAEIGLALRSIIQGQKISTLKKDEKEFDIILSLEKENILDIDHLKNISLTSRMGKKIPLSSLSTLQYSSGQPEIKRIDKEKVIKISANILPGYSTVAVNQKIKKELTDKIPLPEGYQFVLGGQAEQFGDLLVQMVLAMLLAILFMYMILASLYNSFIQPLILMLSVPLAIIGAMLGLLITFNPLNIYAFIGILLVLGLVAKNGILLIDFANHRLLQGDSIRESIIEAGKIRLRPILMTSFAMIFGMLPLALGLGEGAKGKESLPVVVIGGLLTSTFLTLLLIPIFYEFVENKIAKKKKSRSKKSK